MSILSGTLDKFQWCPKLYANVVFIKFIITTPQSGGKVEYKQLVFHQNSPDEFEDCAKHFLGTLEKLRT